MRKLPMQKVKMGGNVPSPRFGHTFTMVSKTKGVLFGGAVSVAGKFIITNQSYLFDFQTSVWKKLAFPNQAVIPCERAAHAAATVSDMQMVVYGGAASGSQNFLRDELYLLDLRKEPSWKVIDTGQSRGNTPGQRYGHTMIFNKPYLIIFGGNSGNKAENDVWLLNIMRGPFTWEKYEFQNSRMPCPRVYHSAALCEEGKAQGMMVVFGGRRETKKQHNNSTRDHNTSALNDIWGLVKHRNGVWDWATPPRNDDYCPISRFQHLVCFMGSKLVIVGGRTNDPEEALSTIQMYDTETAEWERGLSVSRYRHAIALQANQKLFIHGGFEPEYASQPLESMICVDLNPFSKNAQQNSQPPQQQPIEPNSIIERRTVLRQMGDSQRNISTGSRIRNLDKSKVERDLTPSRIINSSKNTRLSSQVVIAKGDTLQIQRVPVNTLMEESKKLNNHIDDNSNDVSLLELTDNILGILMPRNGTPKLSGTNLFPLKKEKILRLCSQSKKILANQTSLVGSRAPVKVFGSLYGRYSELLRFFDSFGYPDEREMEAFEYVFLGNYVDKSFNSLETISLLMALKIKYPDRIHLLRGKHEDICVNRVCGLGEECSVRLGENIEDSGSVFETLNRMFELLPLGAAVEDKFLCVNEGIGMIKDLRELNEMERPVRVKESPQLMSMFWRESDQMLGYKGKKCSEEQLEQFLEENGLDMLINSKDGLANGLEEGKCSLSVFSVSNYGRNTNKGCILRINKDLGVVPYMIKGMPTKANWVSESTFRINHNYSEGECSYRKSLFEVTN